MGFMSVRRDTLKYLILILACLFHSTAVLAESVTVRYTEGLTHGFLVLRTQDGKHLADGDSAQFLQSDRVTNHLTFRFDDGSLCEETSIFSQRETFRLLNDHVLEKGPAFTVPMESSIDTTTTGDVTVRYKDKRGKEQLISLQMELPKDLANGILFTLLKNLQGANSTRVTYLAVLPKPKLMSLMLTTEGFDSFRTSKASHKAAKYIVKVEIGGVADFIALSTSRHPCVGYGR